MKVNTNIETKPMKTLNCCEGSILNSAAFIWKPKNNSVVFVKLQKYECLGCVTTTSSKENLIGETPISLSGRAAAGHY